MIRNVRWDAPQPHKWRKFPTEIEVVPSVGDEITFLTYQLDNNKSTSHVATLIVKKVSWVEEESRNEGKRLYCLIHLDKLPEETSIIYQLFRTNLPSEPVTFEWRSIPRRRIDPITKRDACMDVLSKYPNGQKSKDHLEKENNHDPRRTAPTE